MQPAGEPAVDQFVRGERATLAELARVLGFTPGPGTLLVTRAAGIGAYDLTTGHGGLLIKPPEQGDLLADPAVSPNDSQIAYVSLAPPERNFDAGSDLWVANGYAYTGTWGTRNAPGNAVKVWQLGPTGAPTLVDSIITPGIGTVSDIEVSSNGKLLMFSTENGPNAGVYFYSLADPAHPTFLYKYLVSTGVHTATLGYIGGRVYAFGAKDPGSPALMIWDVTSLTQ